MLRKVSVGLFSAGLLVAAVIHFRPSSPHDRRLQSFENPNFDFSFEVNEAKAVDHIPLDTTSALYNDVLSVTHNPTHRRIKVTMKPNEPKCPSPILRGRLSGRALGMIKWEAQRGNVIKGYYEMPFGGYFFLELIVLFCSYDTNDLQNCLVPGETNRLTVENAEIMVEQSSRMKGFWASRVMAPLPTRWQPENCRGPENMFQPRCANHGSAEPFDRYTFHTYGKIMDRYNEYDTSLATQGKWRHKWAPHYGWNCFRDTKEECDFCAVGSSHSNRLHRFVTELLGTKKSGGVRSQFPQEIQMDIIESMKQRCKNIVIGYGQHDIAFGKTPPEQFALGVKNLLIQLQGHPRVFGRSVNYNPLGDEKLSCPPTDNRNPTFIDDYNNALEQVYIEMNRPWIDTRWINEPLWDAAVDWNHLHYKVEFVQTFFIADFVGLLDE